jgi:L-alanine-DL-glutamate epimerase-like enolase superfamily enzyme
MKVARWVEARYIDLMPRNLAGPVCTAATIHLAAVALDFARLELRVSLTENLYSCTSGVNTADALQTRPHRQCG